MSLSLGREDWSKIMNVASWRQLTTPWLPRSRLRTMFWKEYSLSPHQISGRLPSSQRVFEFSSFLRKRSTMTLLGTPPWPSPYCLESSSSSLTRTLSYLMLNLSLRTSSIAGSFSGGGSTKFMIFSSTQKSMNFMRISS